jgi:hypothetical protein
MLVAEAEIIEQIQLESLLTGENLSRIMNNLRNSDWFDTQVTFYDVLGVPGGLGRSGNVSKRLWDVLELLCI